MAHGNFVRGPQTSLNSLLRDFFLYSLPPLFHLLIMTNLLRHVLTLHQISFQSLSDQLSATRLDILISAEHLMSFFFVDFFDTHDFYSHPHPRPTTSTHDARQLVILRYQYFLLCMGCHLMSQLTGFS